MNTTPKPDYGEPWGLSSFRNCIVTRGGQTEDIRDALRNRSLKCVNACAGMADPSKEIEELKECRTRYIEVCANLQECVQKHSIGLGGEKLDQLVCAEIEAMREAIKAAHEALIDVENRGRDFDEGHCPYVLTSYLQRIAHSALAKLQPFITQ